MERKLMQVLFTGSLLAFVLELTRPFTGHSPFVACGCRCVGKFEGGLGFERFVKRVVIRFVFGAVERGKRMVLRMRRNACGFQGRLARVVRTGQNVWAVFRAGRRFTERVYRSKCGRNG